MRAAASSRERPATSVSHDNASIPVALRMAMASRCTSERGSCGCSGARASSSHLMTRPCRSGNCDRSSGLASSESRSMVRCCDSLSRIVCVYAATTMSSLAATSAGGSSGSSDSTAGLGVGGRQQRALAREVPVRGRPRDGRRLRYLFDRRRPSLGDDRTCRGLQRVAGPALLICAPVQLVRR